MTEFSIGPHLILLADKPDRQESYHKGKIYRDAKIFPWGRSSKPPMNSMNIYMEREGEILRVAQPSNAWGEGWWLTVVPPEEWPFGVSRGAHRVFTRAVQKYGIGLTLDELFAKSKQELLGLESIGDQTLGQFLQWAHGRKYPRLAICPTCGTEFISDEKAIGE